MWSWCRDSHSELNRSLYRRRSVKRSHFSCSVFHGGLFRERINAEIKPSTLLIRDVRDRAALKLRLISSLFSAFSQKPRLHSGCQLESGTAAPPHRYKYDCRLPLGSQTHSFHRLRLAVRAHTLSHTHRKSVQCLETGILAPEITLRII